MSLDPQSKEFILQQFATPLPPSSLPLNIDSLNIPKLPEQKLQNTQHKKAASQRRSQKRKSEHIASELYPSSNIRLGTEMRDYVSFGYILKALGYLPARYNVSNIADKTFIDALTKAQQELGVTADGVLGKQSASALLTAFTADCLKKLGYLPKDYKATGQADTQYVPALKKFQKENNLSVSGIVGKKELYALTTKVHKEYEKLSFTNMILIGAFQIFSDLKGAIANFFDSNTTQDKPRSNKKGWLTAEVDSRIPIPDNVMSEADKKLYNKNHSTISVNGHSYKVIQPPASISQKYEAVLNRLKRAANFNEPVKIIYINDAKADFSGLVSPQFGRNAICINLAHGSSIATLAHEFGHLLDLNEKDAPSFRQYSELEADLIAMRL